MVAARASVVFSLRAPHPKRSTSTARARCAISLLVRRHSVCTMKLLTTPLISMLFLATAVEFAHARHAVAARRYAVAKTYKRGKPMEESGVRCQGYKNVMQVGLGKSRTSSR